ncbi:CPBP family intramembrane metalloprotease [Candidatus Bathyarchaeota archaeon]|nr:CPBP family intramembrane metalloprotease [Candidatus Bathyarchaeota archaeon]MBS7630595.1 CPBP family intramembrane metalloprotease [Candidatus Bathyarchaeota archaeon]
MRGFGSEGKNLLLFFLIAFAWSWFFWFLQMWGLNFYVAPFGPFVAAFLLTFKNEGKFGAKELLKNGFDPRIEKIWYLPSFLLIPAIAGFSLLLARLSEKVILESTVLSQPWIVLWNFVYIFFLGGPLQEEFGWRGYALIRLQARYSALVSSVVLGVIWAIWHLPLNLMYLTGPQYQVGIAWLSSTVILFVFVSILFTWIYNNTGGSILATLIFHTMLNLSTYVVFPVFETETGPAYYFFSIIVVAIIILAIFGAKRMVRDKSRVNTENKISDHFE